MIATHLAVAVLSFLAGVFVVAYPIASLSRPNYDKVMSVLKKAVKSENK